MNKQELIEKLKMLERLPLDREGDKDEAARALLDYINDPEITEVFLKATKFYAED